MQDDSAVLGSNGSDTVYANYSKIGTYDARNQQQQRSDPNWNGATSREGTLDRNAVSGLSLIIFVTTF